MECGSLLPHAQASLRTPKGESMREAEQTYQKWRHAPPHLLLPDNTYMVTAGTYRKKSLFNTPDKLNLLQNTLIEEITRSEWLLEAWAILANHSHFIAQISENSESLPSIIQSLHSKTAIWLNRVDNMPSRKVWFQYWDSCITHEKSYWARLKYVHTNPVRHGIVEDAGRYPWCSFSWFIKDAEPVFRQAVLSSKIDRLSVRDDF
jgi:putative transposase